VVDAANGHTAEVVAGTGSVVRWDVVLALVVDDEVVPLEHATAPSAKASTATPETNREVLMSSPY
jgi:hypothetical protein